jgi:hypothetical protein
MEKNGTQLISPYIPEDFEKNSLVQMEQEDGKMLNHEAHFSFRVDLQSNTHCLNVV